MNNNDSIIYAQLGLYAMQMSPVEVKPEDLPKYIKRQYEKFPIVEEAIKYAKLIGII